MKVFRTSVFLLIALAATSSLKLPVFAESAQQKIVTLAESKPYQSANSAPQHFTDSIPLAPGQDKLNLTLTYYNGTKTKPAFKWLRINSSSMRFLTENQFINNQCSVSLDGKLPAGTNQIRVDAGGVPGATFGWRLTALVPKVTSANPTASIGSTLSVKGENFSTDIANDSATIDGTKLKCVSATPTTLTFQIPESLKAADEAVVQVKSAGIEAGKASVKIKGQAPSLASLSSPYVAPGYDVTIYGGPFAGNSKDLRVAIGNVDAQVVESSASSIKIIAPMEFAGEPFGIDLPVTVWSHGVKSRNALSVNCYSNGAPGVVIHD